VALFKIKEEGNWSQDLSVYISPGSMNQYTIIIQNESEVAVDYIVDIKNESQNIQGLTFKLQDADNSDLPSTDKSGECIFTGNAAPNESEPDKYSLTFDWAATAVTGSDSNLDYMGMVDYFTITVSAVQVD
jgi:hypothetical protein